MQNKPNNNKNNPNKPQPDPSRNGGQSGICKKKEQAQNKNNRQEQF